MSKIKGWRLRVLLLPILVVLAHGAVIRQEPRSLRDSLLKEFGKLTKADISKQADAQVPSYLKDKLHGVRMGIKDNACDNGKDGLEIDWDRSPLNYTCYHPKNSYPILPNMMPIEECEDLPQHYVPRHYCMNRAIHYQDRLPTHGAHRPLWPVFGEYKFVPPQRWLHSVEHGGIVMLYHPCTQPREVEHLKTLLKRCLRKHVITPSNLLPAERPLALIAWGCRLLMNHIQEMLVVSFIRRRALHGPEGLLSAEGQYTFDLIEQAMPPLGSDADDTRLCPEM